MKKFVETLSRRSVLIISFVLFAGICILTNYVFKQSFPYLTQTLGYSPAQAYSLLEQIGEAGRSAHLRVFILDFAMVVLYCAFLVGANYATFSVWIKSCKLLTAVVFLPLVLGLVQLSEIILLSIIILNYPANMNDAAVIASMLTTIKYYLTVLCFISPVIGLLGKIVKNVKLRRNVWNE